MLRGRGVANLRRKILQNNRVFTNERCTKNRVFQKKKSTHVDEGETDRNEEEQKVEDRERRKKKTDPR